MELPPSALAFYDALAPWYRLIDPPEDHAAEAAAFVAAFERWSAHRPETLLELGAGAGHNASHLAARFRCTLTDPAPAMLALSRELNPGAEHVAGDMRTLRLGRQFDAVLVHDAVTYLTTEADLLAAATTAFAHLRPGGVSLWAPDCTRETFHEAVVPMSADAGTRSLRGLEWSWDPDPSDTVVMVEYALLLLDGADVRAVHDRHVEGMFPEATWVGVLERAGFRVERFERPIDDDGTTDRCFAALRPA